MKDEKIMEEDNLVVEAIECINCYNKIDWSDSNT